MIYALFAFIGWLIVLIDLLIMTLVVYGLSWLPSNITRYYFKILYQHWCWCFIRVLGVNLKLHQKNIYPIPSQYILIGNHPSLFEDLGMPALFPHLRFLAKEPVKHWWIVGKISQATGTIYVKRDNKHDRHRAFQDLNQALHAGDSIGIYPEGGCKGRRIYLPFKHGAFKLSLQTQVPIVPIFLSYESQEDFEWQDEHILIKIKTILLSKNKTAHYYLYDAIYPAQFKTTEEFCNAVENYYLQWQRRYLD